MIATFVSAQSSDITKAKDYYTFYIKEGKLSDLNKAYQVIQTAYKQKTLQNNYDLYFYYALIAKQLNEVNQVQTASNLDTIAFALQKAYSLSKDVKSKEQLLKLIQFVGFDLYSEGINQFKAGNHLLAYNAYQDLLKLQSILAENKMSFSVASKGELVQLSSKDIMNNLAIFCINSGKKEEAKNLFEEDIKTNPTALGYARLIQLCYQIEDKVSAERYIDTAIKLYPNDEDILVYAINRNLDQNKTDEAIQLIDRAITNSPNHRLYLVKSQALENSKKIKESIDNYRKALTLYPEDFDLNYGLAYILFNNAIGSLNQIKPEQKAQAMADIEEAKQYFIKAKNIDVNRVDFDKIFEQINQVK